jgi:hypothetical protein
MEAADNLRFLLRIHAADPSRKLQMLHRNIEHRHLTETKHAKPLRSSGQRFGGLCCLRLQDEVTSVPAGAGNFSRHHRVQTGSGAHPASYPMDIRSSIPEGKAAGEWSWPLGSINCRDQECVELYFHSPIRIHGAVLRVEAQGQLYFLLSFTFMTPFSVAVGYILFSGPRCLYLQTTPTWIFTAVETSNPAW